MDYINHTSSSSLSSLASSTADSDNEATNQMASRGKRRVGLGRFDDTTSKNPVVVAMLNSNNMRDCQQIRDMYLQCTSSESVDRSVICDAASRYFVKCSMSDK